MGMPVILKQQQMGAFGPPSIPIHCPLIQTAVRGTEYEWKGFVLRATHWRKMTSGVGHLYQFLHIDLLQQTNT